MAPRKGEISPEEKELVQVISKGNVQDAAQLLGSKEVRVNCLDEHGMTPLMHAAYKGKEDMCKLLLQHGADVNCNEHEHGYTALMFACLSGQHDCVTVINHFFPREKLDYYTKPQGLNQEPKLPMKLAGPLHKVITTTNLHPVKILFLVKESRLLMDPEALKKCGAVLELICERCMKQKDMNEVLAMKMHYVSCIMQRCATLLQEGEDKLDAFIKTLLKGRDGDCFPVAQEKFIRESIRKFPYCEATLLQQLVRSIAPVEIGSDPTAFSVLTQAITGQVGFVDAEFCTTCGEKGADKRCSVCKLVIYCDQNCQKLHWFTHKKVCKTLKEKRERQEAEVAKEKRRQEKQAEKESKMTELTAAKEEEPQEAEGGESKEQEDQGPSDGSKEIAEVSSPTEDPSTTPTEEPSDDASTSQTSEK
ncbi:ankyrin repeat and MYND domain-containing protein 2 isoform X2 [Hyperolius riggenbachi]|uniref:ankyrin repeat and MYND domain-containing protein 2 isoform X2 n=1 Tax=Hyperolius riggenbachi TaxID=752182 RepID=UPI0035A2D44C